MAADGHVQKVGIIYLLCNVMNILGASLRIDVCGTPSFIVAFFSVVLAIDTMALQCPIVKSRGAKYEDALYFICPVSQVGRK